MDQAMRLHLFELEDLDWFPRAVRDAGLDHLRYTLQATHFYDCVVPLIKQAMDDTGATSIVDLCSGGGGSIEQIQQQLSQLAGKEISVTLTDKFPNLSAYRWLEQHSGLRIGFRSDPIDATDVPKDLTGFRTMFSAIHHFTPEAIQAVLRNAAASRAGIGIFDGSQDGLIPVLGIPLNWVIQPLVLALCTPFFRPFRWSRLFFTYVIPLIPLYTLWDGSVSVFRLYGPDQLRAVVESMDLPGYVWKVGQVRGKFGAAVLYVVGTPSPQAT
jgi:hypothetical protein